MGISNARVASLVCFPSVNIRVTALRTLLNELLHPGDFLPTRLNTRAKQGRPVR